MTQDVEKMKATILAYVGANDLCTFPDMIAAVPGAAGDYVHELAGRNVILWAGLSLAASRACTDLFYSHHLFLVPAETLLPYVAGHAVLDLPIAKSADQIAAGYKDPHWLPVLLTLRHPMPARAAADFAAWAARSEPAKAGT